MGKSVIAPMHGQTQAFPTSYSFPIPCVRVDRGDTEFIRKSIIADTIIDWVQVGAGLQPHKKSGNPVKSRLPLQIKEARDGDRTRDPLLGKEVLHR